MVFYTLSSSLLNSYTSYLYCINVVYNYNTVYDFVVFNTPPTPHRSSLVPAAPSLDSAQNRVCVKVSSTQVSVIHAPVRGPISGRNTSCVKVSSTQHLTTNTGHSTFCATMHYSTP